MSFMAPLNSSGKVVFVQPQVAPGIENKVPCERPQKAINRIGITIIPLREADGSTKYEKTHRSYR